MNRRSGEGSMGMKGEGMCKEVKCDGDGECGGG